MNNVTSELLSAKKKFVNNLKPEIVVPMHYSMEIDQISIFRELVNDDTKVIIMDGIN